MDYVIEAAIFVIMVFIVIGRPEGIMTIGNTLIGRALMIALIVCLALKSTVGGLLGALLLVVVSESLVEGMETGQGKKEKVEDEKDEDGKGKKDKAGKDGDEKDEKDGDEKHSGEKNKGKEHDGEKDDDDKAGLAGHKEKLSKLMGGTDLVGLTEKFSKLRSLADAINRSQ
jgi:hypothetical protein